jgi:HEAT repeat protein
MCRFVSDMGIPSIVGRSSSTGCDGQHGQRFVRGTRLAAVIARGLRVRPHGQLNGSHNDSISTAAISLVVLLMLCTGSCQARDPIPVIPSDVSPKIRSLIERTLSDKPAECAAAAQELGDLPKDAVPAIPFLVRLLSSSESDVVDAADRALKKMGATALQPLLEQVTRPCAGRYLVVSLLSNIEDGRAVEPLIELLDDSDKEIRRVAASGLQGLSDVRATRPLIKLLETDADAIVRTRAARALGYLYDRAAVEPLIAALQRDPDASVRKEAALALGQLHDARAFDPLVLALETDRDIEVQGKAALALGWLRDTRAVGPILAFMGRAGGENSTRFDGIGALGHFRDPRAIAFLSNTLLEGSKPDRNNVSALVAAGALGLSKDCQAIEPLVAVWQDNARSVTDRVAAALSLAATKDYRVVDALGFVMANGSPNKRLRALELVADLRDPRVIELAQSALRDEDERVRIAASIALKRHELVKKQKEWLELQ